MAQEHIFRVGDIRRLSHTLTGESAFTVTSVAANIYTEAGALVVPNGVGGSSAGSATEHEIYYLWDTSSRTAGRYSYVLKAVVGSETLQERGFVELLPLVSKYDPYVMRAKDWLLETAPGEDRARLTEADYRRAVDAAKRAYEEDRPQVVVATQALTSGVWEYELPSDWTDELSRFVEVEYPVDATQEPRTYRAPDQVLIEPYRNKWSFGQRQVTGDFYSESPSTGETARLVYTTRHTLTDTQDTLPSRDFEPISTYAAGQALMTLANQAAGTSDPQVGGQFMDYQSKQRQYREQARELMAEARKTWLRREFYVV